MKTLRLNRFSVSWFTYQWSTEWLLKDEKGVGSRSRPSNHGQHALDAGLFSTRHDVIRGIPRVESPSNGLKCQRLLEEHSNSTILLGGRYGNIIRECFLFRPHSISVITVFTGIWAEDGIVISTTGCGKSTYWYIYMISTILLASAERSLFESGNFPGTPRWRSFWHNFDHLCSKKISHVRNLWTRLVGI